MKLFRKIGAQFKLRVARARARFGIVDIGVRVFKRYSEDDGGFYAAGLTYYTFFSIFPLILFATSALGYIAFLSQKTKDKLIDAGVNAFPLVSQILEPETLDKIEQNRGLLALIALVLGLYSGSGGIVAMEHALNRIYRVLHEESFVAKRVRSLKFLVVIGLVIVLSLAITAVGTLLGPLGKAFSYGGGYALSLLMFGAAFKFLTHRAHNPWREVLPGAAIAALVFELLKIFGSLYLESGRGGREETFGPAFATAAALLVAAYLLCQVTLLAAETNAVLAERRKSRQFPLADQEVEGP